MFRPSLIINRTLLIGKRCCSSASSQPPRPPASSTTTTATTTTEYKLPDVRLKHYKKGSGKGPSPTELRGRTIDESDNLTLNLDAFQRQDVFPTPETFERLFDGIPFADLPVVTIRCCPNNTRFWLHDAKSGKLLEYDSPRMHGYVNAAKRTNVAAQVTGQSLGQSLRNRGIRTVRVRVDGFNNGRVAAVKGIAQIVKVASVTDVTPIDWHWSVTKQKRKRQN